MAEKKKRKISKKETKKEVEVEEEKISKKEQIKHENKLLRNFLLGIAAVGIILISIYLIAPLFSSFTYNGVHYQIVQDGKLTFYNTKLPVVYNGKDTYYNFYIRTDPRKLDQEIPFNGILYTRPALALNISGFNCQGDGVIATANLVQLYSVMGAQIISDPQNASCDPQGRYVYINVAKGNKTEINETAPACYIITVKGCEILPVLERYMTETFETVDEYLRTNSSSVVNKGSDNSN